MEFGTRQILELFNIHDLRVIAAKLGQSDKYGMRSSDKTGLGATPITKLPKTDLVDIIAGLADIVIMTNPEQRSDDDLNTDFILDKFNIGTLRAFVKHIGKQDEIKTFRRVEKAGKMVSENLSKPELMEKVKPLVRFGLNTISTKAGIVVPDIQKPAQQDELFTELGYQINIDRRNGMLKANILEKINSALDDALNDVITGTVPINNNIYQLLKDKQLELSKSALSEEKQRSALRKYVRAAKKYSKELIDTKFEKLSTLATTTAQELLTQRETERTEPKPKKRQYNKGGASYMLNEIKPVGRPQIRDRTTLETKTKRELQRELKVEKDAEKNRAAEEKFFERQAAKEAKDKIKEDKAKLKAEKKQNKSMGI